MSDERLRELERRWKETGSVEDEAAFLLERVRVGELTQERLELAAYCGHEAAARAVGTEVEVQEAVSEPSEWLRRAPRSEPEVAAQAAVAVALKLSPYVGQLRPADRLRRMLDLVGTWAGDSGSQTLEELRLELADAEDIEAEVGMGGKPQSAGAAVLCAVRCVVALSSPTELGMSRDWHGAANPPLEFGLGCLRWAARTVGSPLVVRTAAEALRKWALA